MTIIEAFNRYLNEDKVQQMMDPYFGVNCGPDHLMCEGDIPFRPNGLFDINDPGRWYRCKGYDGVVNESRTTHKWRVER